MPPARAALAVAVATEQALAVELTQVSREADRLDELTYPTVSATEQERARAKVDVTDARLRSARAATRARRVAIERHVIAAPFDGVVTARRVDPGDWGRVGLPVLEIVSVDEVEVHVDVAPSLAPYVRVGGRARLLGPTPVEARIEGIVPILDDRTRTMRIRLRPLARPDWLLAGRTIDVEFTVERAGEGVRVPRDALVRGPVATRVVKVVDGKAVLVTDDILATADDAALVHGEELGVGDAIVVRGNERLRAGQPVRIEAGAK